MLPYEDRYVDVKFIGDISDSSLNCWFDSQPSLLIPILIAGLILNLHC